MTQENLFETSTGNVFADLGLENADELYTRGKIGIHVLRLLKQRNIKQREITELLEIPQPEVSHFYGCSIHIDMKNEKIWIQWNGTEINIAEELVLMGVPKQDIVIGFHSPLKRQFTDFAVG